VQDFNSEADSYNSLLIHLGYFLKTAMAEADNLPKPFSFLA